MNEIEVDLDLGLNPFCFETELKIETRKRNLTVSRGTELIERKDTSKTYFANIVHTQEVDKEEFIKLYTSQIKAYFDLTKTAYKVFFIFLRIYQDAIGKDHFYLSCKKAMSLAEKIDHFVLSESIFYRGVKELIEKRIIAKTNEKNWYFINPAIVFNGDRARFVSEIIKKKEVMEEQPESVVSTDRRNKNLKEEDRSIESVIEEVNSQEDIDLLIARLQAKKSQAKMMDKNTDGAVATKGEMLLYPEETLDWDNIHGEDFFTKMTFSDRVR
jgi:NACalpha-BTF3-like transcription factor